MSMITMEELKSSMCKWPIGDPRKKKTFHFCGAGREEGGSYCEEHSAMSRRGFNAAPTTQEDTTKKAA